MNVRIDDDHMYHGAALIQIAERPQFTAINCLKVAGAVSPAAYKVNDEIAVYLKYAWSPTRTYQEYTFTFHQDQRDELSEIAAINPRTFVVLVCVEERDICCISYEPLQELLARRETAKGGPEDQYSILVTAPQGKRLRVYVNAPGVRNKMLGKEIVISRSAFPSIIFG